MTVLRVRKTENFVSIHKECLENPHLSFKAKGVWAYCMTRVNNWEFRVSHLATVSKEKEDAIYSAIKELEAAGYCKKVQKNIFGRFQTVDYEIYETSQLKKCLPQPGFPDAGFPDAENPALINIDSNKSSSFQSEEEEYNKSSEAALPPPSSANASVLSDLFLSKIKERNPKFKQPNLNNWIKHMILLLDKDKRNFEEAKSLIEWISDHTFWKNNCLSPEKFRRSYDQIFMQKEGDKEKDLIRLNRQWALACKEKYTKELKDLAFDSKYASHRAKGKEVSFSLPHEQFKIVFTSMFRGSM